MVYTEEQIIETIHGARQTGKKVGLTNTRRLLEACAVGYHRPTVHVAGTNGKGSTCAMTESILRAAGYRTGLYTSPFLQRYHERIRLNGVPISGELLVKYGSRLLDSAKELEKEDISPTPFEYGTALALSVFEGEKVDIAICEVGLGGRLDPTNVLEPSVCAVTAIGLDHVAILGDTVEAIAAEKAGIFKPETPVVCAINPPTVCQVFEEKAAAIHAPLVQLSESMITAAQTDEHGTRFSVRMDAIRLNDLYVSLPGYHQAQNALTVLGIVAELRKQGFSIPDSAVRQGLQNVRWPARLEWCGNLLLDGAHNAHGLHSLQQFVQGNLQDRKRILLTGVLADKISDDMLSSVASLADTAYIAAPDNHRAMPAEEYAALLQNRGVKTHIFPSPAEALAAAKAAAGEDTIIVTCGSLYFAGEIRDLLGLN